MDYNIKTERVTPTKLMIKMVWIAGLIIIALGLIYYIIIARTLVIIPFALGVAITTSLNVFKLRMLEKTVQKVVQMDDQNAGKNVVRIQQLVRFLLTGAVLFFVGLIDNLTTVSSFLNPNRLHIPIWATLFPNAPETLLISPFISMWGALAGLFTLQISVILIRTFKLETDGDNFVEYVDESDDSNDSSHDNL